MSIKKTIDRSNVDKIKQTTTTNTNKVLSIIENIGEKAFNTTQKMDTINFNQEHIVKSGETLSEIAKKYNLTYQELADYNNINNVNYIEVGQAIKIPEKGQSEPIQKSNESNEYVVQSGETLSEIAKKYNLNYQELVDYNNIKNANYIEVGQIIKIPPTEESTNNLTNEFIANIIKDESKNINDLIKNLASELSKKVDKNQESMESLNKIYSQIKDSIEKSINGTTEKAEQIMNTIKTEVNNNLTKLKEAAIKEQTNEFITNFVVTGAKDINNILNKFSENIAKQIKDSENQKQNTNIIDIYSQIANYIKNGISQTTTNVEELIKNVQNKISIKYDELTNKINTPTKEHTISSGETLSAIAQKYNITLEQLIKANNIVDPNNINVGQVIKIPNSESPKVHNRKTDINTANISPNSNIAKAIKENKNELNESFRVKVNEKDFITMKDVTVEGRSCILTHVIIEDPSQINGEPANGEYATGVEKTSDAAKRKQATLMINGSNFIDGIGTQDLRNTNHITIVNGKIMNEGVSQGMEICLDKNGRLFTPNPGTTASELIEQGVIYSFASLDSRLIWNGEKDYVSQPQLSDDTEYNSTIIAMKEPGEYYILTGETTNRGARDYLYDIGCTYAKSMDQGGSVSLVLDGEVINNPTDSTGERRVGDFLYFT